MKFNSGFTLIELLIALGISAIVALGTVKLFESSVLVKDTVVEYSEVNSKVTRAMRIIQQDLTQLSRYREVKDEYGQYKEALELDKYDGLTFTRSGWARSQFQKYERSTLQRVNYLLEEPGADNCPLLEDDDDNDLGGCLIRSFTAHLDNDGSFEPVHQMLLRPVSDLEWSFYILDTSTKVKEYKDEPPQNSTQSGSAEQRLLAIKLSFNLNKSSPFEKVYITPTKPVNSGSSTND